LANIEEKVEELISSSICKLGYELYDVEYVKEGKEYFLRVYIDSISGITLEDCEKVSNLIEGKIEEANYIPDRYFLEVSSPGIERVLKKEKHLNANIGNLVSVKLYQPLEKQKQYVGKLLKFDNNILQIETDEKIIEIERKNISQIKTIYNWD